MPYNSFIALTLIVLSNIIVLLAICFLGIKFHKIRRLNIIYIRQYFLSMCSTVIIGCLFPTTIAAAIFFVLFFLYRSVIFKNDALEIQCIYAQYNGFVHLSPPINNLSCIFAPSVIDVKKNKPIEKQYRYAFSQYSNNAIYIFVFYCVKGMAKSENTIWYGLEFFIAITALYIAVAKLIYHLSLTSPNSLFFLCPNLSYIPVVLVGLLFYGIAILIFITTL